jgi:hypothetical protein
MKRTVISLFFLAAGLINLASVARAQDAIPLTQPLQGYYAYGQLSGVTTEQAIRSGAALTTVPMGPYTITSSRDSNTYSGVLVGRSPFFHGSRTTNVTTFIVPVKVHMPDGGVFDPGVADSTCLGGKVPTTVTQNSPIFQSAAFTMDGVSVGTTQYPDAFQRAEFWQNLSVTANRYHVLLSPTTTTEQTFNVPTNKGGTFSAGHCGNLGIMDLATWDSFVQGTLLPFVATQTGGGTTAFPIFLLYNVVIANPFVPGTDEHCCILGYHNAVSVVGNVQTYGVSDFDSQGGTFAGTSDISALSHEVSEWMNDPLGNNPTPNWGHIGQVAGCQNNLAVGDPLSGTLFPSVTLSSFTYHPQELAFFSWFFGTPSTGTDFDFSNNETFEADAGGICS